MDLHFSDMIEMQQKLQELHAGDWRPCVPENARRQLLWGIGELGEVIDIVKKRSNGQLMNDPETRAHLIEEMSDFMMYFTDVLLCYRISAKEYSEAHFSKHMHNRFRDFTVRDHYTGESALPQDAIDACRARYSADDLRLSDLIDMQQYLLEKHPDWGPYVPEEGAGQLLWTLGEIGEVIDVIKHSGDERLMTDPERRAQLLAEMSDVMMHFINVFICYSVSADEYASAHTAKHERNMKRDYREENARMFAKK